MLRSSPLYHRVFGCFPGGGACRMLCWCEYICSQMHRPYPKPCQDLHLPQHPIHQPQLAKGGRAIVVFDTWFMGKKAV